MIIEHKNSPYFLEDAPLKAGTQCPFRLYDKRRGATLDKNIWSFSYQELCQLSQTIESAITAYNPKTGRFDQRNIPNTEK